MEEKRREKSKKDIDKRSKSEEKRVSFVKDFDKFLETQEKKSGKSEHELMENILSSHVALIEFDETLGRASLVFENWKGVAIGEPLKIDQKTLKDFRDLRDNFAPVSAGIEWHKDFTCYDNKTEVLTEDGWKLFKDLTNLDRVATLSPNDELEFQSPLRKMTYDYDGNLWQFKNQQIDLMVTPNHKILMRSVGRNRHQKPFKLMEVSEAVKYQKIEMKKNAKWNCSKQELFFLPKTQKTTSDKINQLFNMDDWLEFFGYYLSEGCTYKKSGGNYTTKISQNKFVHPETYHKIENCIKRLGYNYYANDYYFTICNKQLWNYLKQFGKAWKKFIPNEIKLLPPEKLQILYNALIDGDGTRYKNTNGYFSSSKRLIDDMQEILLKLGFAGNVKLRNSTEVNSISYIRGRKIITKHQGYRIFELDYRGLTPIISRKDIREVYYKGKIYSCEVPNHILYVRRNGVPIWSGNSGGGFLIQIDDPKDAHQKEMRETVKRFCMTVFQDQYVIGLDAILDIMMDIALTDGCAAAEIVYEKEVEFNDYLDEQTPVEEIIGLDGKKIKVLKPKVMTDALWKSLGGITRLKIIEDSYTRLIPYRHPISGEVLYWTLDEKSSTPNAGLTYEDIVNREKKKTIIKFHPWEIFWLSWNKHGTNLKGLSLIQPVYSIAKMAQIIQTSVGKGYNRWANKKYFFVCVPPETEILTTEGYKSIEEIAGEIAKEFKEKIELNVERNYKLITCNGEAIIEKVYKRPYIGKLITIKAEMLDAISFTPEHPILIAKKNRIRTKEGHEQYIVKYEIDGFTKAEDVKVGDYVIVPKFKEDRDFWMGFPDLSHREGRGYGRNPIPIQSQCLSEDLAKLFGWYLAEGSITDYAVHFALNITEEDYALEIAELSWEFLGLHTTISKKEEEHVIEVSINSKVFAEFMMETFGCGANDKHLPSSFLYWKPNILKALISRIVKGDGSLGKDNWIRLKLNSQLLQRQLQLALLKIGYRASLFPVLREPISEIQGREIHQNPAWVLTWNENSKIIVEDENNYYFRINNITTKDYSGFVYNLRSTSGEFNVPFATHNCGTERRPWNKVYRQEFLKAMEKMIANNWVGTPVPWGFDIKEIGGEASIFDGKNILDHLISMIAAGMQYPLDFLESGRTQASDKSWLAWTVRYGRSQNQIRRAMEHQLFETHLRCKFGSTVKESRKGPNQKDLPIYIPKLQWKAEGQWLKDAKMKTLTGLLNVANPIDYPLKIPIQKEMGATLGIGEIDWTEIEDLFDTQNKTRLATAKIDKLKTEAKLEAIEQMTSEELANIPEPQPQKPQTPEEKLKEQGEKRQEKGVSRTTKETGTESKKGLAKGMGGTRKVAETIEFEIPQEIIDKIKKAAIEEDDKGMERILKKLQLETLQKKKEQQEKLDEEIEKVKKKQ